MERFRTNWAGNVTYSAARIQAPASLGELQSVVSRSTNARVLGGRHSFNTIADSPDTLISLAEFPRDVAVDSASGRVKVSGGVRYAELAQWLHGLRYAVHNLASLPHISVAGACATATHGSGDANGNLATAVSGLELVTADGDVVTMSREADGEAFNGAVVALGALGVVTGLTLDVVPAFEVRQFVYEGLELDALADHFDEITSCGYSVSLFTAWREPRFDQVWVKQRISAVAAGEAELELFGARLADGPRNPVPGMPEANATEQLGVPGPWFERLPHFKSEFTPSGGEELQSEYLVPRRHAVAALRALEGLGERIAPVLQISEIRTVTADGLWLSPSYRRDVVGLHFTWVKDEAAVGSVLPLLEERLAPFEARPHWGKVFTTAPEALWPLYERLGDFRELAGRYDPKGVFRNDFVNRYVFADGA